MGRRKIEIKAIKDDRNRSVTFLKRKGGLFKKAHELSVLCSVDVAVIIFGQNKKLYQYSSGDMQQILTRHAYQYGQAHEHKGPADFAGKGGGGDDDDDDDENPPSPEPSPPHHGVMPHNAHALQNQNVAHHQMVHQHNTPQNSPPLNGSFSSRMASPQPPQISRPPSRGHVRRVSSNLVPENHPHRHAAQAGTPSMQYNYTTHPQYYPHQQPTPPTSHVQAGQQEPTLPIQQHHPQQQQQHFPPHATPPPPHSRMQQLYVQDHRRRQSMPPNFPIHGQDNRHQQPMHTPPMAQHPPQPPQQQQQHHPHHLSPPPQHPQQPQQEQPPYGQPRFRSPQPQPQPQPRMLGAERKSHSHSIFTPVDDDRSILAKRFGFGMPADVVKRESAVRPDVGPRSASMDESNNNALKININGQSPRNQFAPPPSNQSGQVQQQQPPSLPPPPCAASAQGFNPAPRQPGFPAPQGKRPSLKVQIPSEQSEAEPSGGSSGKDAQSVAQATTPVQVKVEGAGGRMLPAPSPRSASAGAVLSAGATGPANPFARPAPPAQSFGRDQAFTDNVQTPASALPSRMMGDLMNSPSGFWGNSEWNLGSFGGANSIVSPATYQPTPIQTHAPPFRDEGSEKRRNSSDEPNGGPSKKAKT